MEHLKSKIDSLPMKKQFQLQARIANKPFQLIKNEALKPKITIQKQNLKGEKFVNSPIDLQITESFEMSVDSKRKARDLQKFEHFYHTLKKEEMSLNRWKNCAWRTWTYEEFVSWFLEVEEYIEEREINQDLPSPMDFKGLRGSTKRKLVSVYNDAVKPKRCRRSLFGDKTPLQSLSNFPKAPRKSLNLVTRKTLSVISLPEINDSNDSDTSEGSI